MQPPFVSVITPTYNHETFIAECIQSVIQQTYQHWEQIIVDDCSTDRTIEIAESFADPRITVLRKPSHEGPSGLHASYNTALRVAKGALIAVLEGDDYWPPNKLAAQVPFHEKQAVVLSWGGYYLKQGCKLTKKGTHYSRTPWSFPNTMYLLVRNIIPAVTVVATKQALERIGGFWQPPEALFVDHPTWLRLSTIGELLYIPDLLGVYRRHEHQISRTHEQGCQKYSYPADVAAQLANTPTKAVNFTEIRALRAAFRARDDLRKGNVIALLKLLELLLRSDRLETAYRSLKVLLYSRDMP